MSRVIKNKKKDVDRDWKPPPTVTATSSPETSPTPYEWQLDNHQPKVKMISLKKEATSSLVESGKNCKVEWDVKSNVENKKEVMTKTQVPRRKRKRCERRRSLKETYTELDSSDDEPWAPKARARKQNCTRAKTKRLKTRTNKGKQSWGWLKCNHCKQMLTPNTGRTRNGWLHYYTVYRNDVLTKRVRHVCPSADNRNIERSLDYRFKDCLLGCETSCISLVPPPPESTCSPSGLNSSPQRSGLSKQLNNVSKKRRPKKQKSKKPGPLGSPSKAPFGAAAGWEHVTLPSEHGLPPEIKVRIEGPVSYGIETTEGSKTKNELRLKEQSSLVRDLRSSPQTVPVSSLDHSYIFPNCDLPMIPRRKRKQIPSLEWDASNTTATDRKFTLPKFMNESWFFSALSLSIDEIRKEVARVRSANKEMYNLLSQMERDSELNKVKSQKQGEILEKLLAMMDALQQACNIKRSHVKPEPGS